MKEREGEKGNGEISKELTTLRIAGKMGVASPARAVELPARALIYGIWST